MVPAKITCRKIGKTRVYNVQLKTRPRGTSEPKALANRTEEYVIDLIERRRS
jgi:hypothetical protein